ncbi:MAG: DUF401 family protein [Actinobacteria bacterium]|nr:DUF401 family protein [Actinomycetota bacterium]
MLDLVKIAAVFALVLGLLRLRWNLGLAMLIGAAVLGALMGFGPVEILTTAAQASVDTTAVSLMVALALIMVLEHVLRTTETLKMLVDSLQRLLGDNRVVMALMPAIIGILPSAGGARFSAPLVEESANGCLVGADRKSFINYWFRHIWEYVSPLYPGFILTAAMTGMSMGRLFVWQAAFPLTVLLVGTFYGFRGVHPAPHPRSADRARDLRRLLASSGPILAVMMLVMVLGVDIALALTGVVAALFLLHRYSLRRIAATLRESVSVKTLLLVLGVLVFKGMLEDSGAVNTLPRALESAGVPVVAILFLLPFVVGLMTGITVAYVGITFPLILPLIGGASGPDPAMLAFAFASGFAGVMFSPVHLCLVLTKDYFRSSFTPIYRTMLVPEGLVVMVALIQLLVFDAGKALGG